MLRTQIRSLTSVSGTRVSAVVARSQEAPFALEELVLRNPKEGEVLVKIEATGICHTDLVVKNMGFGPFPIVLGHEGAGVVEVGSADGQFVAGDKVLMSFASCGSCPSCWAGAPPYCNSHGPLNFDAAPSMTDPANSGADVHASFFQQSSFATHAVVPTNNLVKIPSRILDKVDIATLAPLGCGIQTGAGVVSNSFQAETGSSIAIFGCGAVGLSAVMAAHLAGCKRVVALDLNADRVALAKELGATDAVQLNGSETTEELASLVKERGDVGSGGVTYSVDTTGQPTVIRASVESLGHRGSAAFVAPGQEITLDTMSLLNGKSIRGVIQGDSVPQTFLPHLMDLHVQGRFPFDKMLTFYDGLSEINRAIADNTGADAKTVKAVLRV